jgi:hypothetical protein
MKKNQPYVRKQLIEIVSNEAAQSVKQRQIARPIEFPNWIDLNKGILPDRLYTPLQASLYLQESYKTTWKRVRAFYQDKKRFSRHYKIKGSVIIEWSGQNISERYVK